MLNLRKRDVLTWCFIVTLVIHFIAEAIRRFYYYSNGFYLAADLLVITMSLCILIMYGYRRPALGTLLIFLTIYFWWGLLSLVVSGNDLRLIAIGARPLIVALAAFIVAESFFRLQRDSFRIILKWLGIALLAILLVALVQLQAGVGAPINRLPVEGAGYHGMGHYSAGGIVVDWVFRPTSIFMHTGRLGQISYYFSLIFCLSAILMETPSARLRFLAFASVLLVVISGQRAAGVFLVASILIALIMFATKRTTFRLLIGVLAVVVLSLVFSEGVRELILARFSSGFIQAFDRAGAMTRYWYVSFARYPLFGEGVGFFSFGGNIFGGSIYYEYMRAFGGGGENSWLRIQGESGIPGLLIFFSLIFYVFSCSFKRVLYSRASDRWIHLSCASYAAGSMAWAFTHDVYSNYLYIVGIFLLFGASTGLAGRRMSERMQCQHTPNVTEQPNSRPGVKILNVRPSY